MKLEEALELAFTHMGVVCPKNTKQITLDDVILALSIDENNLPKLLGYSASGDGGFKNFRKKLLPNKPLKTISYIRYILYQIDLQQCRECKEIKSIKDFSDLISDTHYGKQTICKLCDNSRYRNKELQIKRSRAHYTLNKFKYIARNSYRRAKILQRTPKWANISSIKEFYKNCPEGYHVDHIIPLQGELVSGLHIIDNLQYLAAQDNLSKSNKYIVL